MSEANFEISKTSVYKVLGLLVATIIGICLYVYEGDRAAIKTNQEAIQTSTQQIQAINTEVKVGKERMNGHVDNKTAHAN